MIGFGLAGIFTAHVVRQTYPQSHGDDYGGLCLSDRSRKNIDDRCLTVLCGRTTKKILQFNFVERVRTGYSHSGAYTTDAASVARRSVYIRARAGIDPP